MNDFTKEELIMMKRLALQHVNQFRENSDCIELMDKMQSLIDNYCEHHKSDGYDYFKIAEDELIMDVLKARKPQLKCKICGEFY